MRKLRSDTSSVNYRSVNYLIPLIIAWAVVAMILSGAGLSAGEEDPPMSRDEKKIEITSDLLVTDNQFGFAEFSGNVRATQGTTTIISDRLKVFYKDDTDSENKITGGADTIEKIVAIGNVRIDFDDKKAVSNQAEYTMETRTLVLSGPDSKVTTGNESISGSIITFYRDTGKIKVEGGDNKRVEAVFFDGGTITDN